MEYLSKVICLSVVRRTKQAQINSANIRRDLIEHDLVNPQQIQGEAKEKRRSYLADQRARYRVSTS